MFIVSGNVIKVRTPLSRGRISRIISLLLVRGGGTWDLDGEEKGKKEGEVATDPGNGLRKHKHPPPPKFYTQTTEETKSQN